MSDKSRPTHWQLFRAFIAGTLITLFLAYYLPITADTIVGDENIYTEFKPLRAPTYLRSEARQFTDATKYPAQIAACSGLGNSDNLFLFSADIVKYRYGRSNEPWRKDLHGDIPPNVIIFRGRSGWPFRAIYSDSVKVGLSQTDLAGTATDADVEAYLAKVQLKLGLRYGIRSPSFFPCNQQWHRIPVTPLWIGLFIDILFWSVVYLVPGVIWWTFRTHRRARLGICIQCGYSLEGLAGCPECGFGKRGHAAA